MAGNVWPIQMAQQSHTMPQAARDASPLHPEPAMLIGAKRIAAFIGATERQIRHWHERGQLPLFKQGNLLAADPGALRAWIAEQQAQAIRQDVE